MSTKYTLIPSSVTERGKVEALFIVEICFKNKFWSNEGYFELFKASETFLELLFPGGHSVGHLKFPQIGPFAAVTLSP